MLVSFWAYSSTLKMEAICSSETIVDFHRAACRYIPEERIIHKQRCESLKSRSYIFHKFITTSLYNVWSSHEIELVLIRKIRQENLRWLTYIQNSTKSRELVQRQPTKVLNYRHRKLHCLYETMNF
jgi:hypothetical protein